MINTFSLKGYVTFHYSKPFPIRERERIVSMKGNLNEKLFILISNKLDCDKTKDKQMFMQSFQVILPLNKVPYWKYRSII